MREFSFEKDEQGKQQSTDATTTHQQHPHLGCINSKQNYKKLSSATTWTSPLVDGFAFCAKTKR